VSDSLEIALGRQHLPGTRQNPLRLNGVDDLDRATRHVARPSEAQARSGNYDKAHVVVGGLQVAIENPRGTMRYGTSPSGARWHVRMPADYGYIKRTMADDGDQVDVYLGPNAYEAEIHPVWVVDQIHPHSGKYDEPKCMVGFPSSDDARNTYLAGFSDGSGVWRIGAVARMTFDQFKNWLRNGNTKEPLLYRVTSALKKSDGRPYCGPACPCEACSGTPGGTMTTNTDPSAKAANPGQALTSVKAASAITGMFSKLLGSVPPAERETLFKDASILADSELSKASSLLETGDDGSRPGMVRDLWSGNPDGAIKIMQAHGPSSSVPPGSTNTGPVQSSSGGGAAKMEGEYSNHAPQGGVQRATEMLGAEVGGMKGAMKSIIVAMEAQGAQLAALKGGMLDQAAVDAAVAAAVSKAFPAPSAGISPIALNKAVRKAVRKAMRYAGTEDPQLLALAKAEEKEENESEEKEEGGHDDVEITTEVNEEEDDAKDEKAKSAANLRLLAKGAVKRARLILDKAQLDATAGSGVLAKGELRLAKSVLKRASGYLEEAISLRGGQIGKSTESIHRKIEKAKMLRKAMRKGDSQAQNQEKWPASTPKKATADKAEDDKPKSAEMDEMKKAIDLISKAAAGMGMLSTDMNRMMAALSGQVQATATGADGVAQRLPPVFALAKAGGDAVSGAMAALGNLRDNNVISMTDFDKSVDTLQAARMGLPSDIVDAKLRQLPPAAREVLGVQSAA
jgi:hypothetical protein